MGGNGLRPFCPGIHSKEPSPVERDPRPSQHRESCTRPLPFSICALLSTSFAQTTSFPSVHSTRARSAFNYPWEMSNIIRLWIFFLRQKLIWEIKTRIGMGVGLENTQTPWCQGKVSQPWSAEQLAASCSQRAVSFCLVWTGENSKAPPRLIKRGGTRGTTAKAALLPRQRGAASTCDRTDRRYSPLQYNSNMSQTVECIHQEAQCWFGCRQHQDISRRLLEAGVLCGWHSCYGQFPQG